MTRVNSEYPWETIKVAVLGSVTPIADCLLIIESSFFSVVGRVRLPALPIKQV